MKRLTSIILCLTLLFCYKPAYSDNITFITIEEAQELALKNNTSYNWQDSYIVESIENYDKVVEANEKNPFRGGGNFITYFNNQILPKMNEVSANSNTLLLSIKKKNMENLIKSNIINVFIEIEKTSINIENAKQDLNLKQNEYEIAKLRYELGYITYNDLQQVKSAYNMSVSNKSSYEKNLNSLKQNLNRMIGRDIYDYNYKTLINIPDLSDLAFDKKEILDSYLKNSFDVQQLKIDLYAKETSYNLTKEQYDRFADFPLHRDERKEIDKKMERTTRDYEDAKYNYDNKVKEIELYINDMIAKYESLLDSISNMEDNLKTLQSELEKAKLLYQTGMISKFDLQKSEYTYKIQVANKNALILDLYNLYRNMTIYL